MDRDYAKPLDVPALARIAFVSEFHFIRVFRATFGETPHRYLQRRRVERGIFSSERDRSQRDRDLLRRWIREPGDLQPNLPEIVGEPPTTYRARAADLRAVPACF